MRKQRPNLLNSDRSFNYNSTTRKKEMDRVVVTRLNEKEIEEEMDELKKQSVDYNIRNNKKYILYHHKHMNNTLHEKIFDHGGHISYYTDNWVPHTVYTRMSGMIQYCETIFRLQQEYDYPHIENIINANAASTVSIDCPVVIPDISPHGVSFALSPLRSLVDSIKVSFPPLEKADIQERHKKYYQYKDGYYYVKPVYKYEFLRHIKYPVSSWGMSLWVICDSVKDKEQVDKLADQDYKSSQGEDKINA